MSGLKATPEAEKALFDATVHALRMAGWSRLDAEGEALSRQEARRAIVRAKARGEQ